MLRIDTMVTMKAPIEGRPGHVRIQVQGTGEPEDEAILRVLAAMKDQPFSPEAYHETVRRIESLKKFRGAVEGL